MEAGRQRLPPLSGRICAPQKAGISVKTRLRRLVAAVAISAGVAFAVLAVGNAPASAYGHNGTLDMWQVGMSFNCDNRALCGDQLGGFWGWAQFTRDPATGDTDADADAQLTGCFHSAPGVGAAGAQHFAVDAPGWIIQPGSAGPQTFFLTTGEMTFTGHGQPVTVPLTQDDGSLVAPANPLDTGIPAIPGHYSTSELMGFSAPGISANIQVAFKPAH
jgi:hypothetical protein